MNKTFFAVAMAPMLVFIGFVGLMVVSLLIGLVF